MAGRHSFVRHPRTWSRPIAVFALVFVTILATYSGASASPPPGGDAESIGAPPAEILTSVLSSFRAHSDGSTIVGGERTVTVTNMDSRPGSVGIGLDPAPCRCDVSMTAASVGTIDDSRWTIEHLAPGETADLQITYVGATS